MAKVDHAMDACVLAGIDIPSRHRPEKLIAVPGKPRRRRLVVMAPRPVTIA